jgi:hypothetical protein
MNMMQREITVTAVGGRCIELMENWVQEVSSAEEENEQDSEVPYNA